VLLVKILGVADWGDGGVEVTFDFVADVFGAMAVFLYALADDEVGVFQAVVGDGVGAEVLAGRASRAALDLSGSETRTHMSTGGSRSVARAVAVGACFGLRFLGPHFESSAERAMY
jgi:hypothetical protein